MLNSNVVGCLGHQHQASDHIVSSAVAHHRQRIAAMAGSRRAYNDALRSNGAITVIVALCQVMKQRRRPRPRWNEQQSLTYMFPVLCWCLVLTLVPS